MITMFDVGRLRLDLTDAYDLPEGHPDGGPCDIPLLCYLVRTGGRTVLVDAPACEFTGDRVVYAIDGYVPPPPLLDQMRARGFDPGSVDDVVVTHAHFDHFNALVRRSGGGLEPVFPRARHHIGAADLSADVLDDIGEETFAALGAHGVLAPTEGRTVLGEGLVIEPAPGETPGHQILHVSAPEGEAFITGDLYHRPAELADATRHTSWTDPATSARSRRTLVERAATSGAVVYFAHIAVPHRVERTSDGFRWVPIDA